MIFYLSVIAYFAVKTLFTGTSIDIEVEENNVPIIENNAFDSTNVKNPEFDKGILGHEHVITINNNRTNFEKNN